MATVRFCDYTKKRIPTDGKTHTITIKDKSFELGEEGLQLLLSHLEAEEFTQFTPEKAAPPVEPPEPHPHAAMLDVETQGDPFDATSEPVTGEQPEAYSPPILDIPDNPAKLLPKPSKATYEQVMREAQRSPPNSLEALQPGGNARRRANEKLAQLEEQSEQELSKQAGHNVRFKSVNE